MIDSIDIVMNNWKTLPTDEVLKKTIQHLQKNGINALVAETKEEAKEKIASMLPEDAEVMDMTSVTLAETGIQDLILNSGKYKAVKNTLQTLSRETDGKVMRQMGAAPDYAVGSVHAVTEDGKVLIASNSGSQLPAYAYGAEQVIWVVGAHKIVRNVDEGMKRIDEYVLPLESERAREAYGVPGSNVSKVLIMNKEPNPERIHLIFVKEVLGY